MFDSARIIESALMFMVRANDRKAIICLWCTNDRKAIMFNSVRIIESALMFMVRANDGSALMFNNI